MAAMIFVNAYDAIKVDEPCCFDDREATGDLGHSGTEKCDSVDFE